MNMRFKMIPEKDLKDFWNIKRQYLKKDTLKHLKEDYPKNKDLYVGCYLGRDLIGIAHGYVREDDVVLSGIAMKKSYERMHFGEKLINFFEKQAKKTVKHKITVGAANGPTNVVGFYEKSGYKVVEPHKKYTLMEKKI